MFFMNLWFGLKLLVVLLMVIAAIACGLYALYDEFFTKMTKIAVGGKLYYYLERYPASGCRSVVLYNKKGFGRKAMCRSFIIGTLSSTKSQIIDRHHKEGIHWILKEAAEHEQKSSV